MADPILSAMVFLSHGWSQQLPANLLKTSLTFFYRLFSSVIHLLDKMAEPNIMSAIEDKQCVDQDE